MPCGFLGARPTHHGIRNCARFIAMSGSSDKVEGGGWPITVSNHSEGAPGPSLLGTGEGGRTFSDERAGRWPTCPVMRWE
jgi:hypothetical protein